MQDPLYKTSSDQDLVCSFCEESHFSRWHFKLYVIVCNGGLIIFHVCEYDFRSIFDAMGDDFSWIHMIPPFPSKLVTHIAIFFSVSPGLALVLILLLKSSTIRLAGGISHLWRDSSGHPTGLVFCRCTEARCPFSPFLETMGVCRFQLFRRHCRELVVRRWWTRTFIPRTIEWQFTSWKCLQVLFTILDELFAQVQ